ncbi:MAG: DMT family transporter [Alphaproteobacteria bacterium]|nr:DMT family transporter [Alphaproteobacteria bacterium]
MSRLSLAARRLAAAWLRLPPVALAAFWMSVCAVAFSSAAVAVRFATATLPAGEITFFRNLGALIFLAPLFVRRGRAVFRMPRPWTAATLALWQAISNLCIVLAFAVIPLADAVAISFLSPLIVMAMAALLGIERVGASRWAATLIGFAGMLLIVRPGFQQMPPETVLVLLSATVTAFFGLTVRNLGRDHHPDALVLIALGGSLPILAAVAFWSWRMPEPGEAAILLAIGLAAAVGQAAMVRAYAVAESSSVMPFTFLQLPATAVAAYAAFGQVPDLFTWAGALVIFASAQYTMRRETRS